MVYAIHSRASGNDNVKNWLLFSLARVDSGLRRNDGEVLFCFFVILPCCRQAGRLRASSAVCSRRRSTTYIPVGVPSRRIQDFLSINDGGGNRRIMSNTNDTVARITDTF